MKKKSLSAASAIISLILVFPSCHHKPPISCLANMQQTMGEFEQEERAFTDSSEYWYQKSEEEELFALHRTTPLVLERDGQETVLALIINAEKERYKLSAHLDKDTMQFSLLQNGLTLARRRVPFLQWEPYEAQKPNCDAIHAAIEANRLIMQSQANALCRPVRTCYPICKDGQIMGYMMVAFWPVPPCIKVPADDLVHGKMLLSRTVDALIERSVEVMVVN